MTLHWWMHWFWVTALLMLLSSRDARAFPQSEELQHMTTGAEPPPAPAHRPGERRAKAIYPQGKPALLVTTPRPPDSKLYMESLSDRKIVDKPAPLPENKHSDVRVEQLRHIEPANDSASVPAPAADAGGFNSSEINTNTSVADLPSDETKLLESTADRVSNASQATAANGSTSVKPRDNVTGHELTVADAESPAESAPPVPEASRIVTERPWSLETTLIERAPAAGNQVQASRERALRPPPPQGMDTGAIAGISFAALALAALAGTTAFVLYRRRYLNKPQTLNDKCSNPDSSGYLDDSTIRENSEEMYSLDNDSFLNSLEAMTIQNYWTDNVKHSKL